MNRDATEDIAISKYFSGKTVLFCLLVLPVLSISFELSKNKSGQGGSSKHANQCHVPIWNIEADSAVSTGSGIASSDTKESDPKDF